MSRPGAFRVLLLSGASSVHTIRWANAFADAGLEVHLVSQHDPVDPLLPAVRVHRLPHMKGLGYVLNGPRLRALIKQVAPHVVNAHYATGYGTLAHWVGDTPLVLNVWGSDVYDFPEAGPLHRAWVRLNLRRADVLVSTSEAMAGHTHALCPERPRPTVVPFGVDVDLFRPVPSKPSAGRPLVVGTVKTLAHKYGIDLLLRAFAQLEPGQHVQLHVVGGGPQEAELRTLAGSLGVADRVRFIPRVPHDRVPAVLNDLDVFVALSRLDSESFGVAVIEASACGLPVVVADVGGLPEVVAHGDTGLVVPREDPAAAAGAIHQLLADAALRERMGRAGRALVQQRYVWADCVQRMCSVLEQASRRGTPSSRS